MKSTDWMWCFALQRFQPLIGQSCVGGLSVVEFISDRQLEFYTEKEELQPFEVCVQVIIIIQVCVCVCVCVCGGAVCMTGFHCITV